MIAGQRIAVVIPCHNVRRHILAVLSGLGGEVDDIYVVDDACPEHSGDVVEESCQDHRVRVLRHEANQGVGGAMVTGYRQACADGADIVVVGRNIPNVVRATPQIVSVLSTADIARTGEGERLVF